MSLVLEDVLLRSKRDTLLALLRSGNDNASKIRDIEAILSQLDMDINGPNRLFNLESDMANYSSNPMLNTAKYLGMDFIVNLK